MNDQPNPYQTQPESHAHPSHMPPPSSGQYGAYTPAYPGQQSYGEPGPIKQAELGIASLSLAVLAAMALFVMFIIAGVMESQSPDGMDEEAPAVMILGLFLILGFVLEFVALGLGLGSLFQPNRKKLLGILGIVASLLTLFFFTVIMVAGAMMG